MNRLQFYRLNYLFILFVNYGFDSSGSHPDAFFCVLFLVNFRYKLNERTNRVTRPQTEPPLTNFPPHKFTPQTNCPPNRGRPSRCDHNISSP